LDGVDFLAFMPVCIFHYFYSDAYSQSMQVQHFLWYNPIVHLNQFICGGALGVVFKKKHKKWEGNYDIALLTLAVTIFMYLSYVKPHLNILDNEGLLVILFAPVILLLSLNNGYITKFFKHPLLILAGEISFGLYILAEPVYDGLHKTAHSFSINGIDKFGYFLILLIGISNVVYMLFEKPSQKLIKKAGMGFLNSKQLIKSNRTIEGSKTIRERNMT
jgi:peptidoglycan/LPS O-acetylase OafA/YrhL